MMMNHLRELREDRHLSQQALADMVHTTQQNIHKYENGITEPDIQMIKMFATIFHTSVDYIIEFDPEEYTDVIVSADNENTERENRGYDIEIPAPHDTKYIGGDRLHLLAAYDKCKPPIREHLLFIISELANLNRPLPDDD